MSSEREFGLSQIGQIAVSVSDLERAVAFYRNVLGIPFLFQVPNMAFFDCAGVRLMLGLPESTEECGSSVIYYRVEDIATAFENLKARGAKFVSDPHLVAKMPDHDLWMAFLKDSEDNTVALMSEVQAA
jgi:methylmalonyl-CoA/ethylmalonyl-CoA epimerase